MIHNNNKANNPLFFFKKIYNYINAISVWMNAVSKSCCSVHLKIIILIIIKILFNTVAVASVILTEALGISP